MQTRNLERRIIRLLTAHAAPCTLHQLVHHLLAEDRRDPTVLVLSRGTIRRKRRLERRVLALLARLATRLDHGGEELFLLRNDVARPPRRSLRARLFAWIAA